MATYVLHKSLHWMPLLLLKPHTASSSTLPPAEPARAPSFLATTVDYVCQPICKLITPAHKHNICIRSISYTLLPVLHYSTAQHTHRPAAPRVNRHIRPKTTCSSASPFSCSSASPFSCRQCTAADRRCSPSQPHSSTQVATNKEGTRCIVHVRTTSNFSPV